MNSRERVLTALCLGEPDRVPTFEWIIDPLVIDALLPGANLADFIETMALDAISTGPVFETEKISTRTYRDEWGITYAITQEVLDAPLDGPIKSIADLRKYQPPDPMTEGRLGKLPDYVKHFKGDKAVIFHQRAGFMWAAQLLGLENMLMNFVLDPVLAHATINMVLDFSEALARRSIKAGADIVMLGDDYAWGAGPLMSPAHFREFILPGLSRMVDAIHEEGALCIKHSDGNLWPIIDMIVDTGIDGLNPIDPISGMDIGEVKVKYGERICLLGNIDCTHVLCRASVEDVVQEVKNCLLKAALGGGHILMSSNSILPSAKPENYKAMVESVHKFGVYPLELNALRSNQI